MLAPDIWLDGAGWPAEPGWLGVCGEVPPGPGMAPGPAPAAELIADPVTELTAETAGPTGRPAVRPLVVGDEEPAGDGDRVLGRRGPAGQEHSKSERCGKSSARV